MKKTVSILVLGTLPIIALASGDHFGHRSNKQDARNLQYMGGMQQHEVSNDHDSNAGRPGNPDEVTRTIDVNMDDSMRYTPSQISVKAGETVRFFVKNTGSIHHELVIGSEEELKEHAEMMRRMPDMKHAESNMISLAPGQRGGLVWQFDKAGVVDFACLVPGHMEAGMTGKVNVE